MVDTLAVAERLQETGIPEQQAKAIARELAEKETRLATKDDIGRLEGRIDRLEEKVDRLAQSLKSDMRWLFGITIAVITIGSAMVGLAEIG